MTETTTTDIPVLESPEKVKTPNWAIETDAAIMTEMSDRGLEIPIDNGRLVRTVAIRMLKSAIDASKPLDTYRKMRVIFHRSGREAEAPYLFLGLNGRSFQVPYEVEVLLPEPVVRTCCDNAVITEYDIKSFDKSKGAVEVSERVIRAVPYTFVGYED